MEIVNAISVEDGLDRHSTQNSRREPLHLAVALPARGVRESACALTPKKGSEVTKTHTCWYMLDDVIYFQIVVTAICKLSFISSTHA
jgi:hypothetical protein